MARTVVLTFLDNAAAESLIADLDQYQTEGYDADQTQMVGLGMKLAAYATVNAMVARPTAFCKCPQRGRPTGWARTKRFGWYVCPNPGCGKPSRQVVRNFIKNMLAGCGYDLLPELRDKWKKEQIPTVTEEHGPELVSMTGNEAVQSVG